VTGVEEGNQVAKLTLSTLKTLKAFANFDARSGDGARDGSAGDEPRDTGGDEDSSNRGGGRRQGLSLTYTINLNLPATTDQAVFNAIFRSFKEHLISDNE
jgi:hypothetical protein